MIVGWLFLTMPWVCLQFVIVVFPDHTQFFDFGCLWSVNVAIYVHMFYVHIHLFLDNPFYLDYLSLYTIGSMISCLDALTTLL